jgi:hypothetical protein
MALMRRSCLLVLLVLPLPSLHAADGITVTPAAFTLRGGDARQRLLVTGAGVALVNVGKDAKEAKVELTLPARLRPGPYTFAINGAGQVPRDYASKGDPKKPRGGNVRAVYPANAVTITIGER